MHLSGSDWDGIESAPETTGREPTWEAVPRGRPGAIKKEHVMFESTGEMVITLVLLFATVFPFVYMYLKGRKAKQPSGLPGETVEGDTNPDIPGEKKPTEDPKRKRFTEAGGK
jgi:hypothetical protein